MQDAEEEEAEEADSSHAQETHLRSTRVLEDASNAPRHQLREQRLNPNKAN